MIHIWSEYYCTAWYMNSIFKNGFMAENCHYSFTIGPFLEFKPPLFVTILFAPLFCLEIVGNKSIVNLYCNKTRGSTINVPSFLGGNLSEGSFSYFSSWPKKCLLGCIIYLWSKVPNEATYFGRFGIDISFGPNSSKEKKFAKLIHSYTGWSLIVVPKGLDSNFYSN